MELILAQLLNGLVYGVLLFLMAAGLSLIFGLMNVVSLAHGSFFMLGAFFGLSIFRVTHSFWLGLLLAPLAVAVLGVVMEFLFMRRLYRRGHMDQVLLTFGFTFVFFDFVQSVWGRTMLQLPAPAALTDAIHIGAGVFSTYRLFLIGLGIALAVILWLVLERSRLGAMVRAGVDDAAMAAGLGGNIPALFTGIFGAGVALAGLGGMAAAPVIGLYPGMDAEIMIPAFIVIVIGGMGSLRGAFIGSMLIGEADTFGKAYLPELAMFLIYLVMAVVLLVRPQGLFGIKYTGLSAAPAGHHDQCAGDDAALSIAGLIVLAVMVVFPFLVPNYPRALVSEIYIFAIFAMSLDLLLGFTGLMSLGHAAFFGFGAYAVAVLSASVRPQCLARRRRWRLFAGLGALVIGFFCVRTAGIPFLMLTLAFSQLVFSVALQMARPDRRLRRHGDRRQAGLLRLRSVEYAADVFHGADFLSAELSGRCGGSSTRRSATSSSASARTSRACWRSAIRRAPTSFCPSPSPARFAGLAGGLYAIFNSFISPDAVYWTASGDILIMTMLGGAGTLIGPAIGAGVFLLMKNVVSSYSEHWLMIIGIDLHRLRHVLPRRHLGNAAPAAREEGHSVSLLRTDQLCRAVRQPRRHQQRQSRHCRRRAPRHHRSERRRQDELDQSDRRPIAAHARAASFSTKPTSPAGRRTGSAAPASPAPSSATICSPI